MHQTKMSNNIINTNITVKKMPLKKVAMNIEFSTKQSSWIKIYM